SRRRHTRFSRDWSSDVCSSDLQQVSDADESHSELVTLDGSNSLDVDGAIVRYLWTEGPTTLADTAAPMANVNLGLGVHNITLTRSEERRVGKECRSRRVANHEE